MGIRPVRNEYEHARAVEPIGALWGARPNRSEAERLEVLVGLVDACEAAHDVIEAPDAVEAIKFRVEQERPVPKECGTVDGEDGPCASAS